MVGKVYNAIEAESKRIGTSKRSLERRCRDEQFPFIRFGRLRLFDPELSDKYLAERVHYGRAAELAKTAHAMRQQKSGDGTPHDKRLPKSAIAKAAD